MKQIHYIGKDGDGDLVFSNDVTIFCYHDDDLIKPYTLSIGIGIRWGNNSIKGITNTIKYLETFRYILELTGSTDVDTEIDETLEYMVYLTEEEFEKLMDSQISDY